MLCCDRQIKREVFEGFWQNSENISKAKFSVIKSRSPQICFQFFNLNRPPWFTDFGELQCPWTTLNVIWQLWKLFTVKAWPLVFTQLLSRWSRWTKRPNWLIRRLFTCVADHLDYRLPLDACCSEFLHNCLPWGAVSQFLLACFQRCVLDNPLHHIIDVVYKCLVQDRHLF